jgi:SAM-dependent methyltransferase
MTRIHTREDIIKAYHDAFRIHGDSPSAVLWPKGRQDLRFRALVQHVSIESPCSILDYGCGLGHLKDYLQTHGYQARYLGADIAQEFVAAATQKYPDASFSLIKGNGDVGIDVDHVVASGTFNIVEGDRDTYWNSVKEILARLFRHCRTSLAVNFMTDQVDFVQESSFHVAPSSVIEFVKHSLSRRYTLDHSYLPYEFTVVAYKEQRILRPGNTYL